MKPSETEKYKHLINPQNKESFDDGHLGGCNIYGDPAHELPKTMKYLIDTLNIKSVLDVGCGFGFHSKFFQDFLGLEARGVEGSAKVVELSVIDDIVCHDFTTGTYFTEKTFDLCWCIEFVEHVGSQYVDNFLKTFKCCKYVLMTHGVPGQAGHHHVNLRHSEYWINLLGNHDFDLQEEITNKCRELAKEDLRDLRQWLDTDVDKPPRGPTSANFDTPERRHKKHVCYLADTGMFFSNRNLA